MPQIEPYLKDEAGLEQGCAQFVLLPACEAEAAEVMAWAAASRVPVTLSGGGTGLTGARVPTEGAVLATDRLRAVERVERGEAVELAALDDQAHYTVVIGADQGGPWVRVPCGLPLALLHRCLAERGLWYPPDPTEAVAFVGGTLATNAAGSRSLRYGRTADWVLALRAVLVGGETLEVRRGAYVAEGARLELPIAGRRRIHLPTYATPACKHAAGYAAGETLDLVDLLLGSEGTLALLTEATLRLAPAPAAILSAAFFTADEKAALALVEAAQDKGLAPLSMEYLDRGSLELIAAIGGAELPSGAGAAVLVEVEIRERSLEQIAQPWVELAAEHGEVATWAGDDSATQERLKQLRHALPEAVNQVLRGYHQPKVATDVAVPRPAFAALMEEYQRVMREFRRRCAPRREPATVLFGHVGDQHLHMNLVPSCAADLELARRLSVEAVRRAVELGGTVSAEHGCGRKRFVDRDGRERPWIALLRTGAELDQIARVKHTFDPAHLLGRDVLLPGAELDARIAPEVR